MGSGEPFSRRDFGELAVIFGGVYLLFNSTDGLVLGAGMGRSAGGASIGCTADDGRGRLCAAEEKSKTPASCRRYGELADSLAFLDEFFQVFGAGFR
jgi:hypothetical protein